MVERCSKSGVAPSHVTSVESWDASRFSFYTSIQSFPAAKIQSFALRPLTRNMLNVDRGRQAIDKWKWLGWLICCLWSMCLFGATKAAGKTLNPWVGLKDFKRYKSVHDVDTLFSPLRRPHGHLLQVNLLLLLIKYFTPYRLAFWISMYFLRCWSQLNLCPWVHLLSCESHPIGDEIQSLKEFKGDQPNA